LSASDRPAPDSAGFLIARRVDLGDECLVTSRALTAVQAQVLIDAAQAIMIQIGC
jgi:hypothetical protein